MSFADVPHTLTPTGNIEHIAESMTIHTTDVTEDIHHHQKFNE
jgi:hypothetical protein